ncbi:LacI family DNA-binding transcriptional regulator [Agromyces sp. SYSU T00194]|uniref:LacI family DNA-binding transcriptional regulator n=1 Tax=Agromyces chitinivorans TaxID=3158560 RepID=UPI003397F45F
MATIYDVARRAGVSPATVSRVFNGVPVSEAKTAAVRRAAQELRFVPNRTARTLRTQSAQAIALVIPDIENPYFTEMARGIEDAASDAGYSVVLCNSDGDPVKEAAYLDIAASAHMAGLIIAAAGPGTDVSSFIAAGRPVIAVDRRGGLDVDSVVMANRDAGAQATAHLWEAGYRRIACITGPEDIETARERALGWADALEQRGAAADPALLRYSTFGVDGGRDALDGIRAAGEPEPDAYIAGNNLLGVGVLQRLAERDLTPPRVGVAVIGSLPYATLPRETATVVRLPAREMGTTAARMLLERLAGDVEAARTITLRGELLPGARAT